MTRQVIGLALLRVGGYALPAAAQKFELTPFVGHETSGSDPAENPTGLRGDFRWMATYASSGKTSLCDEFGNCYPTAVHNYLPRFHVAVGVSVRP